MFGDMVQRKTAQIKPITLTKGMLPVSSQLTNRYKACTEQPALLIFVSLCLKWWHQCLLPGNFQYSCISLQLLYKSLLSMKWIIDFWLQTHANKVLQQFVNIDICPTQHLNLIGNSKDIFCVFECHSHRILDPWPPSHFTPPERPSLVLNYHFCFFVIPVAQVFFYSHQNKSFMRTVCKLEL